MNDESESRRPKPAPVGWVIVRDIGQSHDDSPGPFGPLLTPGRIERPTIYTTRRDAWAAFDPAHGARRRLYWFRHGYGVRRATWREREETRLKDGTYQPLVWVREPFWIYERSPDMVAQYAHAAAEDPGAVAFTENPGKGELDRQTRMKAGRYLKRYFGDRLSDRQIAFYAEWQQRGEKPVADWLKKATLRFATTPEEIVDVYARGPTSCMHSADCVGVYGAGDLAIAYLERPDVAGACGPAVIARALVWPEGKALGRIYPNVESWRNDKFNCEGDSEGAREELSKRLRADGYVSFYERGSVFNGARIFAERHPDGGYVLPYIDKLATSGPHRGRDGRDYWTLSEYGDFRPDSTDGRFCVAWATCERCGDDIQDSDDAQSVYAEWDGYASGHMSWCESCADNYAFYCEATENDYSESADSPVEVWVSPSICRTWNDAYASGRTFDCDHDGRTYDSDVESEAFPGYPHWLDDDASVHAELNEATEESESESEHEQA